ncbi:MAG: hypothetical protein RLZZ387_4460 [Chloroflexota bacterium]
MARIVCFIDSAALVGAVRHGLSGREHALFPLPSSRLTDDLRRTVRQLSPDLFLLELTHALDNPHLFIFLRADAATRDVPVVVLAAGQKLALYAEALGADDFLSSAFGPAELNAVVNRLAPHRRPQPATLQLPPLPPTKEPVLQGRRRRVKLCRAALRGATIPALVPALALA